MFLSFFATSPYTLKSFYPCETHAKERQFALWHHILIHVSADREPSRKKQSGSPLRQSILQRTKHHHKKQGRATEWQEKLAPSRLAPPAPAKVVSFVASDVVKLEHVNSTAQRDEGVDDIPWKYTRAPSKNAFSVTV
jgi:hypothetical protein